MVRTEALEKFIQGTDPELLKRATKAGMLTKFEGIGKERAKEIEKYLIETKQLKKESVYSKEMRRLLRRIFKDEEPKTLDDLMNTFFIDERFSDEKIHQFVDNFIRKLPNTFSYYILERYGILTGEPFTCKEISQKYDIPEWLVREKEKNAIEFLRHYSKEILEWRYSDLSTKNLQLLKCQKRELEPEVEKINKKIKELMDMDSFNEFGKILWILELN